MNEEDKKKGKRVKGDLVEILAKYPSKKSTDEDDFTKIFDEQIKILSKQARAKMLKKMILEQEKEISDLDEILNNKQLQGRNKMTVNTPSNHVDIDIRIAAELAKLPEEERKKVIETYTMLRAAERNVANPNMLLPLLIGFSKENKESTTNDMYQWGKLQLDSMKTAFDMAKAGKEATGGSDFMKMYIDMWKEMMANERELRRKEFEEVMKKVEESKQPGLLDSIFLNPEVKNALKEMGLFNPPKSGMDPRIQIELEKLKMMHEKELKRMDMDFQLKLKELETEMNKSNMMLYGLRQIGGAAAAALTGEELFSEETPQEKHEPAMETKKEKLVTLKCPSCGGEITFPESAEIVTCPHCGKKFRVKKKE